VAFINCALTNTDILRVILEGCATINNVKIEANKLESEAVAIISDFIQSNPPPTPTEYMNLRHNSISDDDTLLLASSLKNNTHLRLVNLAHNDITEEGEKLLFKTMYDPTSMDSIVESNHTCVIHAWDFTGKESLVQRSNPVEAEVMKINADHDISTKQKIRRKVVLALCGFEGELFDLAHFNDLPLPIMPRVLELIQEHSQIRTHCHLKGLYDENQLEKDALSRLFHTLRGWELPLLFENLHSPPPIKTGGRSH